MNNPDVIAGKCGILLARITDPLSLLINTITNYDNNAIGYYYYDNMMNIIHVSLYNIFDGSIIAWLKLGTTLHKLLQSPFLYRLTFYPLQEKYLVPFRNLTLLSFKTTSAKQAIYNQLCREEPISYNGYTLINTIL